MKFDLGKFWGTIGIPEPVSEFRFHSERKWRFDYAWPDYLLAVEVDGGLWVGGRHNRPVTMIKDNEKFNHAALGGWRIMKFTPQQFRNGEATEMLMKFFGVEEGGETEGGMEE